MCVGGGYRVEDVFDQFAQFAGDPVGVRNDYGKPIFIVGEVHGIEAPVDHGYAFEGPPDNL
jgi:hypothetical protein